MHVWKSEGDRITVKFCQRWSGPPSRNRRVMPWWPSTRKNIISQVLSRGALTVSSPHCQMTISSGLSVMKAWPGSAEPAGPVPTGCENAQQGRQIILPAVSGDEIEPHGDQS